jgi:hypothetical protein
MNPKQLLTQLVEIPSHPQTLHGDIERGMVNSIEAYLHSSFPQLKTIRNEFLPGRPNQVLFWPVILIQYLPKIIHN